MIFHGSKKRGIFFNTFILTLCLLWTVCIPVSNADFDGNFSGKDLFEACSIAIAMLDKKIVKPSEEEEISAMVCFSYVAGFTDSHKVANRSGRKKKDYCLSDYVSSDKIIRIIVHELRQYHPVLLGKSAKISVYPALKKAFPCKNKSSSLR